MKKLFCYMFMFAALLTLTTACSDDKDEEPKKEQPEQPDNEGVEVVEAKLSPKEFSTAVKGSNAFTLSLIRKLQDANYGNKSILCSPLSASYALGIAAQGADQQTVNEITNVLKLPTGDIDKMNQFFAYMMEKAAVRDKDVIIKIANAFFLDTRMGTDLDFNSNFKNSLVQNYKAKVELLNFRDPNTVGYINNWCNESTNGMIPKIFNNLDNISNCILLNAIYFKGIWTYPFAPYLTKPGTFYLENDNSVELQFMYKEAVLPYTETISFQAIQLPYGNGDYSMTILLPGNMGIRGLLGDLSSSVLDTVMEQLKKNKKTMKLYMPKFKTSSEIDLTSVITLFNKPLPNVTNVTDMNILINYLTQNVIINVDEKGTEGGAVTMGTNTFGFSDFLTLKLDHPFLYLISEKETGAIFFAGIYCGD